LKRFIWPVFILLAGLFWVAAESGARGQEFEELFFRANQAYKEGRFKEAVNGYNRLIRSGHRSGHLYYNLGNTYFRQNDLGRAVLSYERARLFMPRDADLKFNLQHALDQTRDAVPESRTFINQTFFWLDDLALVELLWGFSVLNVLFWGILVLRLFLRPEWSYYLGIVFLLFWLIAGFSFGLKWYQTKNDNRAVVLQKEMNVLSGPDIEDTVLFKLHEGTVVHYERAEDGWSLVRLSEEKRGWVKSVDIEKIRQ